MANSIVLTASGVVFTGAGTVTGIIVTAGSDTATVDLADKATAGGTSVVHASSLTAAGSFSPHMGAGRVFNTGCYATLSGTSPKVTVFFDKA